MVAYANRIAVLNFARAQLAAGVRDRADGFETIQRYYEMTGWRGPRDRRGEAYDGGFAWCGAFAGACHAAVEADGVCVDPLPRSERVKLLSTYRLHTKARDRRVELDDVGPGDVLVVGKRKAYGDHITIVVDVLPSGAGWITIEGNAVGGQVGQTRVEGVVCRVRGRAEAVRAYRFCGPVEG